MESPTNPTGAHGNKSWWTMKAAEGNDPTKRKPVGPPPSGRSLGMYPKAKPAVPRSFVGKIGDALGRRRTTYRTYPSGATSVTKSLPIK